MSGNFLVRGDETHRIDLGDEAWIDIRRCISRGERLDMMKQVRTTKSRNVLNPETRRMESVTETTWNDDLFGRLLLRGIVRAWSDELPVTPENIDAIPEALGKRILNEFDRLNPTDPEQDDELGDSGQASSPITE